MPFQPVNTIQLSLVIALAAALGQGAPGICQKNPPDRAFSPPGRTDIGSAQNPQMPASDQFSPNPPRETAPPTQFRAPTRQWYPRQSAPAGGPPPTRQDSYQNSYKGKLREGINLINAGQPAHAVSALNRALELKPRDMTANFWKGLALDEMGDLEGASDAYIACLNRAIDLGMDSAELRINLGNVLLKRNYIKQAHFDFQRALEIEPSNAHARLGLGHTLIREEQWDQALKELRKCSELGLNDPAVAYLKAVALLALGQKNDAVSELAPCLSPQARGSHPALFQQAVRLKSLADSEGQVEEAKDD